MASCPATSTGFLVREPPVCYYIKSKTSGLVLEVKAGHSHFKPKTYVVLGERVSDSELPLHDQQCWYFERADDSYVYIVSKLNGLVLDIKGHSSKRGTRLIVFTQKPLWHTVTNQKWKIEGGFIETKLNEMMVTIKGKEKVGSYVAMFPKGLYPGQEWVLEEVKDRTLDHLGQLQDESDRSSTASSTDDSDQPQGEDSLRHIQ